MTDPFRFPTMGLMAKIPRDPPRPGDRIIRSGFNLDEWGIPPAPPGRPYRVWGSPDGFLIGCHEDEDAIEYAAGEYLLPRSFWVLWNLGGGPKITLRYVVRSGELVCRDLLVRGRDGQPVTTTMLRSVSVKAITSAVGPRASLRLVKSKDGLRRVSTILTDEGPEGWIEAYKKQQTETPRRGKRLSDETLRDVANVYRDALRQGSRPIPAIAEAFTISKKTAPKWVMAARGRIDPATGSTFLEPAPGPGRAGEKGHDNG